MVFAYAKTKAQISCAVKDSPTTKASTCIKVYPVKTKTALLSRKLILLAILLHGQFIHYTQISLIAPKHTFFQCSAACLSVIFEKLSGLILFTS